MKPRNATKKVAVIGAGLAGLAAAVLLAHRGFRVTVIEKNETVGGKCGAVSEGGYRFDTGPTLLTMPFVLDELFAAVGKRREDSVALTPLEPLCRYNYPDGSVLEASAVRDRLYRELLRFSPADADGFLRFLDHGERIYRAAAEPFLFRPFGVTSLRSLVESMRFLPALARLDAFRTLDAAVREYVWDERLRQLLNRFATYNGSSPFLAPATLAIIPFVEFGMGGWYVRGGMYALAAALRRLAEELGAAVLTGREAERILAGGGRVRGVGLTDGSTVEAEQVICNADALYAEEVLLRDAAPRPRRKADPSLAGFVILLGASRRYPALAHHNIFFSRDYRAEFDALVGRGIPADEPTIYVSASSVTEPAAAPEGHSNLFILVNAPPLSADGTSAGQLQGDGGPYRDRVLGILEQRGLTGLRDHVVVERRITPADFFRRFHAYRGSLYGLSSNSRWGAFLRPGNRSRTLRGLYFAGGSTHPGGGIPLVLLSGRIAAGLAAHDAEGA